MGEWKGTKRGNYVLNWVFKYVSIRRAEIKRKESEKRNETENKSYAWEVNVRTWSFFLGWETLWYHWDISKAKLNFFYNWNRLFLGLVLGTESFHSNQLFRNSFFLSFFFFLYLFFEKGKKLLFPLKTFCLNWKVFWVFLLLSEEIFW